MKKLIIDNKEGCSWITWVIPSAIEKPLYKKLPQQYRINKMILAVKNYILPFLRKLEANVFDEKDCLIQKLPYKIIINNYQPLLRCLMLFQQAWLNNIIIILNEKNEQICQDNIKDICACCSINILECINYYIIKLTNIGCEQNMIISHNVNKYGTNINYFSIIKYINDNMHPLIVREIVIGLSSNFSSSLNKLSKEKINAYAKLRPDQIRAMHAAKSDFTKIFLTLSEEIIQNLQNLSYDQMFYLSINNNIIKITDPNIINVISIWEEDLEEINTTLLKNKYTTVIKPMMIILTDLFSVIISYQAATATNIWLCIKNIIMSPRYLYNEEIKNINLLIKRFLPFINESLMNTMGFNDPDSGTNFSIMLYILEGLFQKQGLGKKFMTDVMSTPEGITELGNLTNKILEKVREKEISKLDNIFNLIQSDIFALYITPLQNQVSMLNIDNT